MEGDLRVNEDDKDDSRILGVKDGVEAFKYVLAKSTNVSLLRTHDDDVTEVASK